MTGFSILALVVGTTIGARAFAENARSLTRKTRTGRTANSPCRPAPFFMDTIEMEWPR